MILTWFRLQCELVGAKEVLNWEKLKFKLVVDRVIVLDLILESVEA